MILFTSISSFINGIAVIIFGLLVWLHSPRRKVNRLMALMCLSVAVWGISWGFMALTKERASALFLGRMLNFGAIFIPVFFLHWVLVLLGIEKEKKSKTVLIIGYILTLFFALFAFTPYFVTVKPKPYFFYYEEPRTLHPFYLLFCYFGLVGYGIYNLFKSYRQATAYKKAQIKYVFLGAVLGFGGGATNYFLFYNIPIPPFGNPLVAVGFGLLTYSIIRYRLMDIRIAFGKGVAYIFSFVTVIGAGILLVYLNNQLSVSLPLSVIASFIALLSILLFQLHKFYEKLAGQYFYPTFYYTKIAIAELEERLRRVLELQTLSFLVLNTLKNVFHLEKVAILIKEVKEEKYIIQDTLNFEKRQLNSFLSESLVVSRLEKMKRVLTREEFKSIIKELETEENKQKLKQLQNKTEKLGIEVFLPLVFEKKFIGIVLLGKRYSGQAFSAEDLDLLSSFSRQVSIALKNATLFAELNKRKEELERFYRLTVERELKMVELRKKIKELEKSLEKKKSIE